MAQAGFTPILIYASGTATNVPAAGNLTSSASGAELAINYADGKLYYKDSGGSVQLIASKSGASGDVVGPASATDNAIVRFDGTTGKLVQNSVVTIADSTGDISGVGVLNATTLDATNIEVTNIKAKDGTAAASIADSTGKITVSTELAVDNLNLSGNTLSSTDTNGNIVLAPNGTGDVQLDADTVRIGDSNANATLTTNGTGDLILNTNSGTNSGSITIADGANGDMTLTPDGNGSVVITNNGTSNALRITQTGSGNAILVEDSTNPDSSPFVVNADGRTVVGHTAPITGPGANTSSLQTHSTSVFSMGFGGTYWAADTAGVAAYLAKSRGSSIGTRSIVSNGDSIGRFLFSGDDGTSFISAAAIEVSVDGTPGTNDMPGRLVFSTTADGSFTPTERMRIDSAGRVGIGTSPTNETGVYINQTSTAANGYGLINSQTVGSTTTNFFRGFQTSLNTTAASFTLSFLNHFYASQGTIGAGSTVTNQYGYFADASLTGATNNYGFFSNIASGTGRWNFYANGTAANYFAGRLSLADGTDVGAGIFANYNISGLGGNGYGIKQNNTVTSSVTTNYFQYQSLLYTQATAFTLPGYRHYSAGEGVIGAGSTVTNQYGFIAESSLTGATNNYGFFSNIASGTGRWNFYAAGTAQNYFAGNVLIGSTSATPSGKLTVLADRASISYNTVFSTYNGASFENDFYIGFTGTVTNVGNYQSFPIAFVTNNTERMRIDSSGNVGIGGTTIAGFKVSNYGNLSGAVTAYSYYAGSTFQSDVTTNGIGFGTFLGTQAASFTLTSLTHFRTAQGTFGAGSTITNQFGFEATNTLTGATNNYGFYSNIASGTGRWNFYASGTAANYFAGDMQLDKTVTATGTTGAQTINKNAGTVNFAAAATSLVVTDSRVTANSIIICTVGTNDTTMKSVAAVAGAGSFTLHANAAATAETRVNFLIIN